jgi:predicted RNA binding protein YcfA (HicA-like mRNA interferase family)
MSPRLPAVTPRQAIRALERAGFYVDHVRGSHHYLMRPGDPSRIVLVAYHSGDLKKGTLAAIIRQSGLTPEEFIRLL